MNSTNIKDKIKIDNLMLLHGKPILIPETPISVFPIKLKEISAIGTYVFFDYLSFATIDIGNLPIDFLKEENSFTDIERTLLYLIMVSKNDIKFKRKFCDSVAFFTKEKFLYNTDESYFYFLIEEKEIIMNIHVLEAFQYIVKRQNFLIHPEREFKPANKKAAEIIEKRLKGRKKVEDIKNRDGDTPAFDDLVASVAAKGNSLKLFNIWNLNYYAFNDQLQRLRMIEDYDIGIKSLMAGADSKKVKLKYWIRSIQSE